MEYFNIFFLSYFSSGTVTKIESKHNHCHLSIILFDFFSPEFKSLFAIIFSIFRWRLWCIGVQMFITTSRRRRIRVPNRHSLFNKFGNKAQLIGLLRFNSTVIEMESLTAPTTSIASITAAPAWKIKIEGK